MFTTLQRHTLAAAMARILPSGDGPGATEAGAVAAGERALMGNFLQPVRSFFEEGLDRLQSAALDRFGCDFAQCSRQQQDQLLQAADNDRDWRARLFFDHLIHLTLEGFLGDPIHGGNQGYLGWSFVGYDPEWVRSGFCCKESQQQ